VLQASPSTKSSTDELVWSPQAGPQQAFVECTLPEVFLGGARGGGKTDGVLGKWAIKEKRYGRRFNAVALRRTTVSFQDAIERSREIYQPLGGKFNESKLTWRMPNGGRVAFGYLENLGDADEYQGRNVTDAWVEESGQYPDPSPIDRMFGVLRSVHSVPIQLVLTANPGGAGQHWLRSRYQLVPFPQLPKVLVRTLPNGAKHLVAVIPARIGNNQILMQRDPEYINRLQLVGSAQLVKAWVDGDWTSVEGAFFDCWSEAKHVLRPVELPKEWSRYRSGDWGSAAPFCFLWFAVVQDDWKHPDGRTLPRGALVTYREWYGTRDPSAGGLKGLKLTAEQVGDGIVHREKADPKLIMAVLDPSAFAEDGGPSIGEGINAKLLKANMPPFGPADNKRVSATQGTERRGPMAGWDQMRARLIGHDGKPMLYFFASCKACCRTLPVLQHDEAKAEDLDTQSEDHAADAVRYGCMARPWLKPSPKAKDEPKNGYQAYNDEEMNPNFDSQMLKTM
jgi:hypothetical protein